MSSTGQILGGIVGGVVGLFVGNPMLGASIGMAIGGAIDPPKGPKVEGPRLEDLSQQTSTYGSTIPRLYGSCGVYGNIFWIENNALKEVKTETTQGGKGGGGGGGAEVTEYSYFATFALALCDNPIAGIGRIWINGTLFYNAMSSDIGTNIENNRIYSGFTLYTGTETQLPNPRMQATIGINNTPAYRGLSYIVFEDLPLKDYGNTLAAAQIKVEVFTNATSSTHSTVYDRYITPVQYNGSFSPQCYYIGLDCAKYVEWLWEASYPLVGSYRLYEVYPDGTYSTVSQPIECPGTTVPPHQYSESGIVLYSPLQVFNESGFASGGGQIYESQGIYVGIRDGTPNKLYASKGTPLSTMTLPIAGEGTVCTDGIYMYVSSTAGAFKYYLNWDTGSFDLVASGSAPPNMMTRASRCCIDSVSGRLCVYQEPVVNSLYIFSLDLQTYDTVPLYQSGTPINAHSHAFNVFGNITILGTTSLDTTPPYDTPLENRLIYIFTTRNVQNDQGVSLSSIVSSEVSRSSLVGPSDIDVTTLTDIVTGFKVPGTGALRGNLEPLQAAYPFDTVQHGYTLKFVRRGANSSIATILEKDLGSSEDGKNVIKLTNSREMDSQIPWRVEVNYIDYSREYDISNQYAERVNTGSVNTATIDLALVMTADQAKQVAEILLYMYWLERNDLKFNLPPSFSMIEPSDILTIQKTEGTYVVRLTEVEYLPNQLIECKAKPFKASTYTSNAVGVSGDVPIQTTLTPPGQVILSILDVPSITDLYDGPSFLVAVTGKTSYWNSAYVYKSTDLGYNWDYISGLLKSTSIGQALNKIVKPDTFGIIDSINKLSVSFYGSPNVFSVSQLQMLNGANHFAYGHDGNWEIIAAQNCVLESDGTYTLTNLLRGRFGTEWAVEHGIYDYVVLLDPKALDLITISTNQISLEYLYKAIAYRGDLSKAEQKTFAYKGVNLKPLCPVYANGSKNPSTNDWTIEWKRRTRIGGELRDNVDASLGETSELYEVEIYTNGSYNVLKRTFSNITTPTVTYTSAQQITDFGSIQSYIFVKIYQISSVVGRGYPLETTIPYISPILSLVHFDTTPPVNEVLGAGVSLYSNAYITATNKTFGTSCVYTNSSGYVGISAIAATSLSDFTIEFWANASANSYLLYGNVVLYNNNIYINGTPVITGIGDSGVGYSRHMAITRKNNVVKFWVSGVQKGPTGSYSNPVNLSYIELGWFGGGPLYSYTYFDEFRISSKSMYNDSFAPPTSSFEIPSGVW